MNKKLSTNILVITLINLAFWYVTIKFGLFKPLDGLSNLNFTLSHTFLIISISLVFTYAYSLFYWLLKKIKNTNENKAKAFYLISMFFTMLFVFTNTLRP